MKREINIVAIEKGCITVDIPEDASLEIIKEKVIEEEMNGNAFFNNRVILIDDEFSSNAFHAYCLQEAKYRLDEAGISYTEETARKLAANLIERSEEWINSDVLNDIVENFI